MERRNFATNVTQILKWSFLYQNKVSFSESKASYRHTTCKKERLELSLRNFPSLSEQSRCSTWFSLLCRLGQQEGINFWGSDLRKRNFIRSQTPPCQDLRWSQFCGKLCYTTRSSSLQVPFAGTLFLRNYLLSRGNAIDPPQNTKRDSSLMAVPSRWKTQNNYGGKTQPLTAGSNLKVHELLVGISLICIKLLNSGPYLLFDIRIQLDCPFF